MTDEQRQAIVVSEFVDAMHEKMNTVQAQIVGALEVAGFDPCPAIKIAQEALAVAWGIWNDFADHDQQLLAQLDAARQDFKLSDARRICADVLLAASEQQVERLRKALIDLIDASQDARCADLRIVIKRAKAALADGAQL